jgi:hypothetical protein
MAINFPNSPSVGQLYSFNDKTWRWSGDYWEVYSAQTGYITGGLNVGNGNEVFSGQSGSTLVYRTLSGGTDISITTIDDVIRIDSNSIELNTFVTGFTYDNSNNLTISRNDDVEFNVNITEFSGITINGVLSACTGIYTSNLYGCSPINVQNNLILNSGLTFNTITNNNTLDRIVVVSTGGTVEYRDLNTISTGDTFVTGFTYDNANTLIIERNDDVDLSTTINVVTGLTVNGTLSATTIDSNNILSGGTNLTNIIESLDTYVTGGTVSIPATDNDNSGTIGLFYKNSDGTPRTLPFEDTYTTGATYDNGTALATFDKNDGTSFTLDLSTIDVNDTFVTGQTFSNSTYILSTTRNDGVTLNTNLSVLASDVFVVSGVYDPATGIVTYTNSTGGTFQVSGFTTGMTDSYTTDAYLSGTEIRFDNNIQGTNFYNVDLLPLLSGKTDNTTFNTYTSDTQTILDSKISGATNLSSTGIFAQKNGDDLEFKGLTSTGSSITITSNSTTVNLEAVIPPSMNTYVTGGTYNESTDTITLTRNDAVTIDITGVTDNFVIAGTYSDSTDTISLLRQDGSFVNITGVTDTFTTGATYDNGTALATFTKNDNTTYTLDLSTIDVNDTFVTGFTYNDANTFTISRNDDVDITTSFNIVTGLTINGNLVVTGTTNISGITTVDSTLQVDGNVNITSNSFFFQGTSVGGGNVSLIGVDSSDVVRIGNLGFDNYIEYDTTINGVLTADTIFLATLPTLNNSGTDLLVRNTTTGEIEYRPVSGITPDTNTFVTGGTYSDSTDTITLTRNDAVTIDITGVTDTFVTGSTVSANTLTISRNDLQDVLQLSGGTNVQFIDNGNNSITLNATAGGGGGASVSFPWKFKDPTTSGDPGTGQFRFNDTVASGITEIYVNNFTNNGIDGSNLLNILDVGDVIYIQQNDDATRAVLFTVSASTIDNTGWFTIPVQYQQGSTIPKKDKICGWIFASTGAEDNTVSNVGVGQGVFKQRNVNDFEFYSLSGGTNTTVNLSGDTIVINSEDIYVIGGTYIDNTDTISLLRNDGNFVNITGVTDTFTTGSTYNNGTALATFTRNDGNTYTLDLSTIDVNDTFVTGFTYDDANTLTISRNDDVDISTSINIVTGLTVNGDLTVTGETSLQSTTASTLTLSSTPTLNNSNTEILSRNSSTGVVEYKDVSTFGGGGINITRVTGTTYTATTNDVVIGVDTSINTVTLYLPDSTTTGKIRYEVKDIGFNSRTNPITITAAGTDLILTTSSNKSFDLSADGGAVILVSTGDGEWWQM